MAGDSFGVVVGDAELGCGVGYRGLLSDVDVLSGWLTGRSVPSKARERELRFLVEFLERRVWKRDAAYVRRGAAGWRRLCESARRSRRTRNGTVAIPRSGLDRAGVLARSGRLGRPVADCDPVALEVHPAIDVPGHEGSGARLPAYVVRSHDERLRQAVDRVMGGASALVTLVGGRRRARPGHAGNSPAISTNSSRVGGGCGTRTIRPGRTRRWRSLPGSARTRSCGSTRPSSTSPRWMRSGASWPSRCRSVTSAGSGAKTVVGSVLNGR